MLKACPWCGTDAPLWLRARDVNRGITDDLFSYHRCPQCDLRFLSPVPVDLGQFYPTDYYPFPSSRRELAAAAGGEWYKIELVREVVKCGRLLEIGPGSGGFALLAADAGFEVEVMDVDSGVCDFARTVMGVPAHRTDDAAAAIAELGPFDCIALWHVLEHVPAWPDLLGACAARLRPGGVLLVATPNPCALQLRLFGRRWTHLDAPRHVVLIPPDLLRSCTTSKGLTTESITMTDSGSIGWNRFGWVESLRHALPGRWPRALAWRTGVVLTNLFSPLERTGGRGSAYTATFRRAG